MMKEMGFAVGHAAGEKVFGDRTFPKTLVPPDTCVSRTCGDLVRLVEGSRAFLSDELQRHSALLLRGFEVGSAEDFSRVVEALGWDEFPYMGLTNRVVVSGRALRSVNEHPIHLPIGFHHEMALISESPRKIIFHCLQRSPEGGQTSVVPSDVIVQKMEEAVPHVVEKLIKDGMCTVLKLNSWQKTFNTDDITEAEKRAPKLIVCDTVKLNEDGTGVLVYGPRNPVREVEGKRVWFNSMLGYEARDRTVVIQFGDGSAIPQEAFEAYERIIEENCVDVEWEKGDVVVVDNMAVQHARRPGKPPRVLLLALSN